MRPTYKTDMDINDIRKLLLKKKEELNELYNSGLNKFSFPGYNKGSIRTCEAQVLYSIIQEKKYSSILDIGTGPGFSAVYLARALKDAGINGFVDTINIEDAPKSKVSDYINIHKGDSLDIVPKLDNHDLILIDSSHTYEQTLKEYKNSISRLNDGGCIVFHDVFPTPPDCDNQGPRGVINDVVQKEHNVVFLSEDIFDIFSYKDDVEEVKRMRNKWEIHNYSYRDRSANAKEAMALIFK